MAALHNVVDFNARRQELIKIKTVNDDTVLLTKDEAKIALAAYLKDELDIFATAISNNHKTELTNKINDELMRFEQSMINYIDDKINRLSEEILERIINRKIEDEVTKRLEAKLEKIKNSL